MWTVVLMESEMRTTWWAECGFKAEGELRCILLALIQFSVKSNCRNRDPIPGCLKTEAATLGKNRERGWVDVGAVSVRARVCSAFCRSNIRGSVVASSRSNLFRSRDIHLTKGFLDITTYTILVFRRVVAGQPERVNYLISYSIW